MAIRVPGIIMHAKQILRLSKLCAGSKSVHVPKGYLAVYVGERQKKRFTIPVSFLNQTSFQELLSKAEEEFGFIIIQWAVSQSLAEMISSSISLLA